MSLNNSEKKIILHNIDEISELFNVSEEREFLQKYFSEATIEKCLKKGQTRQQQTEALCMKMVMSRNKEFYDAFSQYFLKRSDRYKEMYDRMVSGVEMSSREDCTAETVSCIGSSPNEMRRGDRCPPQRTQSVNHSDNTKETNLNLNSMKLTIHVLREKIYQIEEEREFWMRQSADDDQICNLRKELEDLRHVLKKELVEKETLTKSKLEYAGKVKVLDNENGELKRSNSELKQKLENDCEQMNTLRQEIEDLRHVLKKELDEKETLTKSELEYIGKVKDRDDKNDELKPSKPKLKKEEGKLFQYSDEARRRAEAEIFGHYGQRCILCSERGLFTVKTGEQGGSWDWCAAWKRMVDKKGGWLMWWLMMIHDLDNLVVRMVLERRDDTLAIQTLYHKDNQRGNAPPRFTIDCVLSLIIENKGETSNTITQEKKHKIHLVDDHSPSDFVTFKSLQWREVDPLKPPTVKIQLFNV